MTYYVLFFLHLGSRKVPVAGVTPHPHEAWMVQVARNVTMEAWGFLSPGQYLLHDRGTTVVYLQRAGNSSSPQTRYNAPISPPCEGATR